MTLVRDGIGEEFERVLSLDEPVTVNEVLNRMDIEREEVLVSRDGKIISGRHVLNDGDEIVVLDVIAGG